MYVHIYKFWNVHEYERSSVQCQKKEGANPGQLFQAFGPHQQGAAYMYNYVCICISVWSHKKSMLIAGCFTLGVIVIIVNHRMFYRIDN